MMMEMWFGVVESVLWNNNRASNQANIYGWITLHGEMEKTGWMRIMMRIILLFSSSSQNMFAIWITQRYYKQLNSINVIIFLLS